jgi:hypothetical protein
MTEFSIYADAAVQIQEILGAARHHTDCERVIDLVRRALLEQRYEIGRALRAEARAFRDGDLETGNSALTFDGGLRRGARIAENGGRR